MAFEYLERGTKIIDDHNSKGKNLNKTTSLLNFEDKPQYKQ